MTPLSLLPYTPFVLLCVLCASACSPAKQFTAAQTGEHTAARTYTVALRLQPDAAWLPLEHVQWNDSLIYVRTTRKEQRVYRRNEVYAVRTLDRGERVDQIIMWGLRVGFTTAALVYSAAMLHPAAREGDGHIRAMYQGIMSGFSLITGAVAAIPGGLIGGTRNAPERWHLMQDPPLSGKPLH